jgi:uroporphyrinogen decarboxylase
MQRALTWQPVDRPPHFEHMFELEYEAFGVSFPPRESWQELTGAARQRQISECMDIYALIIEQFHWDALSVYWPWSDPQAVAVARQRFGDHVMVGTMVAGAVWSIGTINDWMQFSVDLHENPDALHVQAEQMCTDALARVDRLIDAGAEMISLVDDVAYNSGPFCSPTAFDEFVTPYLHRVVQRVRDGGAHCILHSDGNLMPILDSLLATEPTALHSIDPMAGMDIAEVRRLTHGQVALMGNVQCDLLQHGRPEEIDASARYCLDAAGRGSGYIFSSSNTIFCGVPLDNYRHMVDVYRRFCQGSPQSSKAPDGVES